jgi:uncharacterized metal-binding protein
MPRSNAYSSISRELTPKRSPVRASGRNHDRAILFASPLVLVVGCWQFGELGIIAGASHLLGGLYLSPDLDLISRPYKRWGVLRFIWLPDQRLIPYRSPLSHAPVLGLLLRLAYLAARLSNGSPVKVSK